MPRQQADLERLERYDESTSDYLLAIITDEDQAAKVELESGEFAWTSTLRYDRLKRRVSPTGRVTYHLEVIPAEEGGEHRLMSLFAEGGRGAEFSELVKFRDRLMTFDDRTGLVCEIRNESQLIPRQILMTGSGDEAFKGFKSEWATLYGDQLVVGSHGRKRKQKWVKILDYGYGLQSVDWSERYARLCEAVGVGAEGYLTHEAAEWHPYRREWLFFPRKVSSRAFDHAFDERECGGNLLIIANEDFSSIRTVEVGEPCPERGVSSFKLVPGHPDECIALKSIEIGDRVESYLFCFNLAGEVLQEETFVGHYKCEGIEIL
jgi:soluble calcium-activated nucleotidase 1